MRYCASSDNRLERASHRIKLLERDVLEEQIVLQCLECPRKRHTRNCGASLGACTEAHESLHFQCLERIAH
jgi:hypothetical protein